MVNNSISLIKEENSYSLKRIFDICIVVIVFPIAFPITIIALLLTKLTTIESVIYSQVRVGKHGELFSIYKIRTISESNKNDPELNISILSTFLRLSKIDELPQLFNVLKGNMSIIGPRPEQPQYVEYFLKENPSFILRQSIKPGITGWAQVNLPKAKPKDNLKKLEFDLYYIKGYSWKLDFLILIKTVKIVLTLNSN
jgi:lipopolysaccharide/colanic/teichoic acid biosynthesis glycosyltransferase